MNVADWRCETGRPLPLPPSPLPDQKPCLSEDDGLPLLCHSCLTCGCSLIGSRGAINSLPARIRIH